jgi:hypothetical protein
MPAAVLAALPHRLLLLALAVPVLVTVWVEGAVALA